MALFEYNISGSFIGFASPTLITTPPPPDITVRIKLAQTFTPQTTHTIETARLFLFRIGSPGNFTVDIYAVDGNGHPTGASLCSGTSNGDTLTTNTSGNGRDVDLGAGAVLTADIEYAMVLDTPNAVAGTSAVSWMLALTGTYARGQAFSYPEEIDDETTAPNWWDIDSDADFKFAEYGIAGPAKAENPTPADEAVRVDFSALGLSWDDGGGADTFDVYMGPVGALVLVSSAQAGTTYTVDTEDVPWGETIYWRIDSTNGGGTTTGDTWSFDVVIIRSVKLGANGAFIVVAAKDGVYISTDSGANWSRKTPDAVEDTDWEKGICSSDGTYIIVVSDADAIYRSANSGSSWAQITPAGGDTFSVNKMATSDDGQFMVMVGQNSTDDTESCYISTDYGATWTAKKPIAASIEYTECDISNDGTVITVSTTSNFYISLDSGATWKEQGMASTAEVWEGLSISGDGTTGLVANINDNDEFFIGINTELFSRATWAESIITSAGRALVDDATVADQNTTLGFGIGDSPILTGLTLSGLTPTRLVLAGVDGLLSDDTDLTFAGDTLFTKQLTITAPTSNHYTFKDRGVALFLESQTGGAESKFEFATLNHNDDVDVGFRFYKSYTAGFGVFDLLEMVSVAGGDYQIRTITSGVDVADRSSLCISTFGNTNQLVLGGGANGPITLGVNLIIPEDGFIGSATVTDAIQIDEDGAVTFIDDITVNEVLKVDGSTRLGSGSSDSVLINNAYTLPKNFGATGHLVTAAGGDETMIYTDPGTLSVALAAEVTVADESSDETCFPAFFTAATGNLPIKIDADGLTYNSSTKSLTIGGSLTVASLKVSDLTAARIPFISTDGLLVDTAELRWVTGGVPTLHLNGSTNIEFDFERKTTSNSARMFFKTAGSFQWLFGLLGGSNDFIIRDEGNAKARIRMILGSSDGTLTFDGTTGSMKYGTGANITSIGTTGVLSFVGTGGMVFGSVRGDFLWLQANATQDTWFDISDADINDEQLHGVTHDGSGQLTVVTAGIYFCYWSGAFMANEANKHVEITFSVNGTEGQAGLNHFETVAVNRESSVSGFTYLDLNVDDTINVSIRHMDAGTPDLSVTHLMFGIEQKAGI